VAERAAAEAIEEAIGRLGVLDTLRTSPQLASAKAALTAELEQPAHKRVDLALAFGWRRSER